MAKKKRQGHYCKICWLHLYEAGNAEKKRLPNATKTLRWLVHTLEVFMWPQDYGDVVVDVDDICGIPVEAVDEEEYTSPEPSERTWDIRVEYSNHAVQDFWGYDDELPYHAQELYNELTDMF